MARTDNRIYLLALAALIAVFAIFGGPGSRPSVTNVSVPEAKELIDSGAVVIDVRDRTASAPSHIPGALLVPLDTLAARVTELGIEKSQPVVVYCNDGTNRGPKGTAVLNEAGYSRAVNLKSGIEGWRAASLPTQAAK
jgi:rhodanese-related sulfurtransferase